MCGKVGEEGQRQGRAGPQFRLGVVRVQVVVKWGGVLSVLTYPSPHTPCRPPTCRSLPSVWAWTLHPVFLTHPTPRLHPQNGHNSIHPQGYYEKSMNYSLLGVPGM